MTDVMPTLFECSKLKMRLTPNGCARLHLAVQADPPKPWEARVACASCRIGAKNAGIPYAAPTPSYVLRGLCFRCFTTASRLIENRFCISCYNRHREALIGRNAKGKRPALADWLHEEAIVVSSDQGETVVRQPAVLSAGEVIFCTVRAGSGAMKLGWGRHHHA